MEILEIQQSVFNSVQSDRTEMTGPKDPYPRGSLSQPRSLRGFLKIQIHPAIFHMSSVWGCG